MDKKYKRLIKNSFWTLIGNTGSKLLGFLLLPLYTRWLGTAGFGESDIVTTYSYLLMYIMTLCVADGIFVFTKNQEDYIKKAFFSSAIVFVAQLFGIWLIVWLMIDVLLHNIDIQNSFSNNLWMIFGLVISTYLQQFSHQFVLSLEKIKVFSVTGIIYCLLTLTLSYLLIPLMGVKGYMLSIICANLLTALFTIIISHSYIFFDIKLYEKEKIKELLNYSIPLIPNGIMWWLVSALNRPVMEYNMDLSAIGIFAVANRFPGVIIMVFSIFTVAWNISVFEEYGKDGYEVFYHKMFRMLFFVLTLLASVIIVFSDIIIYLFSAQEFHCAWKYMTVLVVGAIFSCMSGFLGTNFGVVKQSKYYFYSSVWGAVTSVFLNLLLIPYWGLWGASLSVMFSFAVMMVSRYVYSKKYVNCSLLPEMVKYIVVLIGVCLIAYLSSSFLIKVLLSSIVLLIFLIIERDVINPVIQMTINKKK